MPHKPRINNLVFDYYRKKESKWGYKFLLGGTRHLGYYPPGQEKISMRQAMRNTQDLIGRTLKLKKDAEVLDSGCGEGGTSAYLHKKFGYKVTGIDLLPESVDRAKKLGSPGLKFAVGDYTNLKFKDEFFDGVFTLETYVHTPDLLKPLQEFYRVLKRDGRFVMFEYSVDEHVSKGKVSFNKSILHTTAMTCLLELQHGIYKDLLEKTGFRNIKISDVSARTLPMLHKFKQFSKIGYKVFRLNHPTLSASLGRFTGDLWSACGACLP